MFRFAATALTLLSASLAGADHHMGSDLGHSAHVWIFGDGGVSVYDADGSSMVSSVPPEQACYNVTSGDTSRVRCDFYDVISDGKKYVWAAVARGIPKVDVFDIDTGGLVGSFDTCMSPWDLDFHALRDEVWVHCGNFSERKESHMDVFSASSPSTPIQSSVMLHDGTVARTFGKLRTDPSLGDVGYATIYGQPFLNKIDLSSRVLSESFRLGEDNPKFSGFYDIVYASKNQHIFARTQVCCTCGFDGADLAECGHYGSENITISGVTTEGQCGSHCEGGPTDTIGVYEFNTVTNKVIGTHPFVGSGAVDAPFVSPNGDYIVMFGMNGGRTVQILEAGANNVKSEVKWTIDLDFNMTNTEEFSVFDDFAFIEQGDSKLFILASSNEHKVAIVDLSGSEPSIDYVVFNEDPVQGRLRNRQVEWAEGTNYVWIGDREMERSYVVDYVEKKFVRAIDIPTRKILSVVNKQFYALAERMNEHLNGGPLTGSSSAAISAMSADNNKSNTLSIVAIFMSAIAIVAVLANMFMTTNKSSDSTGTKKQDDDPSLVVPSVN